MGLGLKQKLIIIYMYMYTHDTINHKTLKIKYHCTKKISLYILVARETCKHYQVTYNNTYIIMYNVHMFATV